ncbi:hypothetical protein Prudu_004121 [Prunus dulcis]|uniref:Uncharacterized protein n=1 Tax=Prunus dulcis TaxID=3755 RepID=A0A4Y1QUP8_PRUDU|nr:hypothetical protein Prudu_004121 [Prunus dulcis]
MTGNIIVALVHSHFQPVFRPQAVEGRGIHHRANHSFRAKGKKDICARHSPGVGHAQDLARISKWKLGRVLSIKHGDKTGCSRKSFDGKKSVKNRPLQL